MRKDGKLLDTLQPEKRIYNASGMPMTEAAIDAGLFGDRYVSLGEPVTDKGAEGAWALRLYIKPFVDWIWGGCFLMALGGFVAMCRPALSPRRAAQDRRRARRTCVTHA